MSRIPDSGEAVYIVPVSEWQDFLNIEEQSATTVTETYLDLLRLPDGVARIQLQGALCRLRDHIALMSGKSPQDIQDTFEAKVAEERLSGATR